MTSHNISKSTRRLDRIKGLVLLSVEASKMDGYFEGCWDTLKLEQCRTSQELGTDKVLTALQNEAKVTIQ